LCSVNLIIKIKNKNVFVILDNIRPKFMQNERDRGLQGNPNPNRGRDHYGRNNNYSPHASAALGREHR
jgi:hypothetical protein